MFRVSSRSLVGLGLGLGLAILLTGCTGAPPSPGSSLKPAPADREAPRDDLRPLRVVTLAFAGDVHFQIQAAALLDDPRGLGPITRPCPTPT